jgi:hypothetical protein
VSEVDTNDVHGNGATQEFCVNEPNPDVGMDGSMLHRKRMNGAKLQALNDCNNKLT